MDPVLLITVDMLKKKLGIECIELDWNERFDFIYDYYKIPSTLIIPKGCVKVGRSAFEDWSGCRRRLKKVIIPESVKRIGTGAFADCKNLKEVSIPKSVEEIGERAFIDCKKLEKVVIPESVKMIRRAAFCGCKNATIILKKPENDFEEINDSAFVGCKDVKEETRS